ncbi:MAG: hypothetical protein KDA87_05380 [Planctomycetales bacterium]|nr:hypothetical protein [Planctomycetales bacterium]
MGEEILSVSKVGCRRQRRRAWPLFSQKMPDCSTGNVRESLRRAKSGNRLLSWFELNIIIDYAFVTRFIFGKRIASPT